MVGGQRHLAHQMGRDEDGTALGREHLHQVADPVDALRVETVDRLVEQQHLGVAEQRRRDPEPLPHTERETAGTPLGDVPQPHDAQHLVHPGRRDAGQLGQGEQVVAGGAAAVHALGVQQRAHQARGVREAAVGVAVDRDVARGGAVQTEDHAHGRGLPRPVGSEEAGDGTRPHLEGKVVHGRLRAEALGQADCLDHAPAPSTHSVVRGPGRPAAHPRKS